HNDETRDIPSRARKARDEAAAERIRYERKNDWNAARFLQQSRSGRRAVRKYEVRLQRDEFLREIMQSLRVTWNGPTSINPHFIARRPAELLKRLLECSNTSLPFRLGIGIAHQHADPPHPFGLLSARSERPSSRQTNSADEIAASHCPHQGQDYGELGRDYSRDLRLTKWGSGVSLHSSNLKPLMSALGHKR